MGELKTLAVDIGGSGIKGMILNAQGVPITDRHRIETPKTPSPAAVIEIIAEIESTLGHSERVSVGFPGVVIGGVIKTAVNLSPDWINLDLATALEDQLNQPVRVANDADLQGYGAARGHGVELVITLGTGFGSALFTQGQLVPNLELGHHPFIKNKTYEQCLGRKAFKKEGSKVWNQNLARAIATLEHLFNYDQLYIGGGETKRIDFELPHNAQVIPNNLGILGGIALWNH